MRIILVILSIVLACNVVNCQVVIDFSGYTWQVRSAAGRENPGNNLWSSSTNNVWKDSNGHLHLKITRDNSGNWYCPEVYTQEVFGSGVYQFWVEGRLDQLNRNVVFGLFSYPGSDHDGHDEIDIEYSKWGIPLNDILNYTVWPDESSSGAKDSYSDDISLSGTYTTQRYTRKYDYVDFQTLGGFYNDNTNELKYRRLPSRSFILGKRDMSVRMNLWLTSISGNWSPPSDNNEVEVIIHQFKFTPDNCNESFEPNHNAENASILFTNSLNQTSTSKTINSIISSEADQDWYRIPVEANGTLNIDLTNLPADYDVELYPFNGLSGGAQGHSYNFGLASENIRYTYNNSVPTNFFVKVYPKNPSEYSACSRYKLKVNWSPSSTNSSIPGLFDLTVNPECNGTQSQIRLNWTPSSNADEYDVYRNGNLYYPNVNGTQFINNSNLTIGNYYSYFVKARNSNGSTNNSNGILNGVAPVCSGGSTVPGSFSLQTIAECNGTVSQIRLNWTASSNASSYDVYRDGNLYWQNINGLEYIDDNNLNAGNSYSYYVKARNTEGATNNSNGTRNEIAPSCGGGNPGSFSLSLFPECHQSTSQIRLDWTSSNNATSYDVYRNSDLYVSDINPTEYIDDNVVIGNSYSYRVKAKNSNGIRSNSNGSQEEIALDCSTNMVPPGDFDLSITSECSGTNSQTRLDWTSAAGATSYKVYRSGNLIQTLSNGTTQFIDGSLSSGNSYSYRVKALNSIGSTYNSNGTQTVTAYNCSNLLSPGSFTLSATAECNGSSSQIRLNWTLSTYAFNYDIYRNGSFYATGNNTNELIDHNVTPGITYQYDAVASNSVGSVGNANGIVSSLARSCTGSNTPGNFTLTANPQCNGSESQIRLNWTNSDYATKYDIYVNGILSYVDISSNSFLDRYLGDGIQYDYRVVAKNSFGAVPNSNGSVLVAAVNCSTLSDFPGPFSLSLTPICNGSESQVLLEWSNSNSADYYDIYQNGLLAYAGYTGTSILNTFLTPGAFNTYFIVARNNFGYIQNINGEIGIKVQDCLNTPQQDNNPYQIKIYPNPTQERFTLRANGIFNRNVKIEVVSPLGVILVSKNQVVNSDNFTSLLDIGQFPRGVYFVKIEIDTEIYYRTVIKQ